MAFRNITRKKEVIEIHTCDHVQSKWLCDLSWKMQTVINQGLRAPDTHFCPHIKLICRWMRGVVLQNADSKHTFMCKKEGLPDIEDVENEINYCSVHYATHFVYALEIISRKHPNENIRRVAWRYYNGIVAELWHFNVEEHGQLDTRLADVDKPKKTPECPINDNYVRGM
jgi:hypothetical protein